MHFEILIPAALRSLANAARALEINPALMNLRLPETLAAVQTVGNTLVLGVPGGFVPLPPQSNRAGTERDDACAERNPGQGKRGDTP